MVPASQSGKARKSRKAVPVAAFDEETMRPVAEFESLTRASRATEVPLATIAECALTGGSHDGLVWTFTNAADAFRMRADRLVRATRQLAHAAEERTARQRAENAGAKNAVLLAVGGARNARVPSWMAANDAADS